MIRLRIIVTGTTPDHRRAYRELRRRYSRELAHWAFVGYFAPPDVAAGPALLVSTACMVRDREDARHG